MTLNTPVSASDFTLNTAGNLAISVGSEAGLNSVIDYLNTQSNSVSGDTYEIDLSQNITLDQNIEIVANQSLKLIVNGSGESQNYAIIGTKTSNEEITQGFVVEAGQVSLQNLQLTQLDHAVFAYQDSAVTLQNVQFLQNTADGNNGVPGLGGDVFVLPQGGASIDIEPASVFQPGSSVPGTPGYENGIFIAGGPPSDPLDPTSPASTGFITIGADATDGSGVVISSVISDAVGAGLNPDPVGSGVGGIEIGNGSNFVTVELLPQFPAPTEDSQPGAASSTSNLYTGGTIIRSGILELGSDGSAGTGAISFGSTVGGDSVDQYLFTDIGPPSSDLSEDLAVLPSEAQGLALRNTLTNFGQGDALVIGSLSFGQSETGAAPTAIYTPDSPGSTTGTLAVTSDGDEEDFRLATPAGTTFVVSDAAPDSGVVVQLAPPTAPTNPGGGTTPTTPSTPTTTTSPTANNGTNPTVTSPTSNNSIAPTLTFDPNVKVFENQITYSGTTTPGATVALTADTDQPDPIALGTAVGDAASGAWSITYDQFTPGLHDFITGTVTLGGLTTTTASNVDVTTGLGPKQMGFTTIQDNYDAAGDYLGTTFIKGGGGIFARDHHTFLNDGGERYTYTGGSLLKDMQVTSFSASYIDDGNLTGSVLHNDDGTTSIENDAKYQFVNSHHDDSIQEYGSHSHFIFHDGAGHELITGFKLGSDTVALPSDASLDLAKAIQVYDPDAHQFDTTIHLGHDLSITFAGVKKDQLLAHASDFTFHA